MAIPSRQIGWGTEENLLWQISKQLESLTKVVYNIPNNTTTTSTTSTTTSTTTATPVPGNVEIAASSDFDIVGDFTIEMFVNVSNFDGFPRPYSFGAYPAPNAISIEGGGSSLYFWANGAPLLSASISFAPGTWYHICVTGVGSTAYLLVDGVQVNTAAYSGSISSSGLPLTIGYGNEPNSYFNGKMSNFRWTTTQVYDTAGFTVPTSPLINLVGTKLLIFQGNNLPLELSDNSGNGHNATNAGASYSTSNPFVGTEGSLQMGVA